VKTCFIAVGLATVDGVPFEERGRRFAQRSLKVVLDTAEATVYNVCLGEGQYTNDEGETYSEPCLTACVSVRTCHLHRLRKGLQDLAYCMGQESIALTVADPDLTQFILPRKEPCPQP
jgi:hypothetical protein